MKHNPYKVAIISCWVLLILHTIFKVLCADWYVANITNTNIIEMCRYIDENFIVKATIYCIQSCFYNTLTVLAILQQKIFKGWQWLIFPLLFISSSLISWYNPIIKVVIDLIIVLLPIAYNPRKWYRSAIGFILVILFEAISIFIKDIGHWYLNDASAIENLLVNMDTTIMLVLYYLYSNNPNERRNNNGSKMAIFLW